MLRAASLSTQLRYPRGWGRKKNTSSFPALTGLYLGKRCSRSNPSTILSSFDLLWNIQDFRRVMGVRGRMSVDVGLRLRKGGRECVIPPQI